MEPTAAMGFGDGLLQAIVGYVLTIIVAGATAALIWAVVAGLGVARQRRTAAAPVASEAGLAPIAEDDTMHHVAAVAAAVYAIAGRARVVHIGEPATGVAWSLSGRSMHHTSHLPQRAPRR